MEFDDVVFIGHVGKLSRELTEYGRDNDVHESDDTDIVCHCSFCQVFIPMAFKMEARIAELEQQVDQLNVQLAGCSVAALGNTAEDQRAHQGDYGWSASYQDVLELRIKYDLLKQEAAQEDTDGS